MSFWNSLYLNLKEFRYLFLFGFIVFVFNIFLEYNHFLNLKEKKHYLVENALLYSIIQNIIKTIKNTGF